MDNSLLMPIQDQLEMRHFQKNFVSFQEGSSQIFTNANESQMPMDDSDGNSYQEIFLQENLDLK